VHDQEAGGLRRRHGLSEVHLSDAESLRAVVDPPPRLPTGKVIHNGHETID